MSRWKRLLLSLASAIAADSLVIGALALRNSPGGRWDGFLLMAGFALCFIIPVWLLSLPVVLSIRTADGSRLWLLAVIGILIGPVAMFVFDLWMFWHNPTQIWHWPGLFDYFAAAISFVATILYLMALKTSSGRRIQPST
jgi:hypothetical protein